MKGIPDICSMTTSSDLILTNILLKLLKQAVHVKTSPNVSDCSGSVLDNGLKASFVPKGLLLFFSALDWVVTERMRSQTQAAEISFS